MIVDYHIIKERSTDKLIDFVKHYIQRGWEPLGGAFLDSVYEYECEHTIYCQPMVRRESKSGFVYD